MPQVVLEGGGRTSSRGSDFFDDEERTNSILKSLINPTGLNTAWQRVALRLQSLEKGLKNAQGVINALPVDYVPRKEYQEVVENRHGVLLQTHTEQLKRLETLTSKLASTVFDDHVPTQARTLERLQQLEDSQSQLVSTTAETQAGTEALQAAVRADMDKMKLDAEDQLRKVDQESDRLKNHVQFQTDDLRVSMQELKIQILKNTATAIEKNHHELTRVRDPSEGTSHEQSTMLDFIKRLLTGAISEQLNKCCDNLSALQADVLKFKDDFTKDIKAAQKTSVDTAIRVRTMTQETNKELADRPRKENMNQMEAELKGELLSLNDKTDGLQQRITLKLSEFVDHFGKLHETIDDHEHCLRHHAEELENRGTKYELLTLQHQVDQRALKDEYFKDRDETKKVLDWHAGKIESLGLATSMGGSPSSKRGHNRKGKPLPSRGVTPMNMSRRGSEATLDLGERRENVDVLDVLEEEGSESAIGKSALTTSELKVGDPHTDSMTTIQPSTAADDQGDEEEDDDFESDPSDLGSDGATVQLFREQLAGVAMALVGLGHLVLRETKLGTSRNARLMQEKDLLEELKNLRHWISSRMAPSGWDPGMLTTVALRCAHPRENEHFLPLACEDHTASTYSMHTHSPDQTRRMHSADSRRFGGKTKTGLRSPAGEKFTKQPMSARAVLTSGPHGLPPIT